MPSPTKRFERCGVGVGAHTDPKTKKDRTNVRPCIILSLKAPGHHGHRRCRQMHFPVTLNAF